MCLFKQNITTFFSLSLTWQSFSNWKIEYIYFGIYLPILWLGIDQKPGQMDEHPGEAKVSPGTAVPGSEPKANCMPRKEVMETLKSFQGWAELAWVCSRSSRTEEGGLNAGDGWKDRDCHPREEAGPGAYNLIKSDMNDEPCSFKLPTKKSYKRKDALIWKKLCKDNTVLVNFLRWQLSETSLHSESHFQELNVSGLSAHIRV